MQRPAVTTTVHEYHTRAGLLHNERHAVIKTKSADIVHNLGSNLHGAPCYTGAIGIDRDGNGGRSNNRFYYGQHPAHLFFFRNRFTPRPRRLATDIHDVGTLLFNLFGARDRAFTIKVQAAVGKGIRCDVKNPHDNGAVT